MSLQDKDQQHTDAEPRSPISISEDVTRNEIKKMARRKADRRLLIWYSLVYLVMRVHVSNISNSAIMNLEQGTGIEKQLGNLTSQQWAWVLSVFYYPYMFAEPLSTLALKYFSPSVWMSRIMVTWVCRGDMGVTNGLRRITGLIAIKLISGHSLHVPGRDTKLCRHISMPFFPRFV
jgi:hypothetical protein